MKKVVDIKKFRNLHIIPHIKDTLIFFIPTIAASVYSVLDKSVINWITHSETENGYYEQAWKILMIFDSLIQALATVSAPRMANLYANGKMDEVRERTNYSFQFMMFFAFPCSFGMTAIASRFVPIFFGAGYEGTISILYVFTPLVVIQGMSVYIDGLYLVPTGKRLQSAIIVCIGSALNFGLNIIMVLKLSALGAAVATLITETFITTAMMFLGREIIDWKHFWINFSKYCLISAVMAMSLAIINYIIMPNNLLGLILDVIIGIAIYVGICAATKDKMFAEIFGIFKNKLCSKN